MDFGLCPLCKLHRDLNPHYSKEAGKIIEICNDCYHVFMEDIS
ncbi:MAG: hypothetical protein ACREBB_01790 [Nitrosotalea sp.]